MENLNGLENVENEEYFDENYFARKFELGKSISKNRSAEFQQNRQENVDESSGSNFIMNDNMSQEKMEVMTLSSSDEVIIVEENICENESEMHDADEHRADLKFSDGNFVDNIIECSRTIKELEERIEHKNKMLLDSEATIKVLFTQTAILQKQVLQSNGEKCDYMIEDLESVSNLLERLDKLVGKAQVEAEVTLWEKEKGKTKVLMNNLIEYFDKTIQEIFSKNYRNLSNVPIFTMLMSDNASILHKQFLAHYTELYSRGQINASSIESLYDDFFRIKSDVQRDISQLSERANIIFRNLMQLNRVICEYNSDNEDEAENSNPREEINNNNENRH